MIKSSCPHCGKKGISFFSRFLASTSNLFGFVRIVANCEYCKNDARLSLNATIIQFVIASFLSVFVFFFAGESEKLTYAYLGMLSIITVGFVFPLNQDF